MNKISFGTGGWRAIIGEDFVCENVRRVAKGISLLMQEEKKTDKPIIIGFDRRFLSENAAKWVAEVFAGNGVKCKLYTKPVPTPAVMYTVMNEELDYGVTITASHNPYYYNGIKIFLKGRKLTKIEEEFNPQIITNILEIKYLDFLGVAPLLDGCVICDKKNITTLSLEKGGFVCKKHITDEYIVSEKTIKIIRMLKYVDIKKISKLTVSNDVKNEIIAFLNSYLGGTIFIGVSNNGVIKEVLEEETITKEQIDYLVKHGHLPKEEQTEETTTEESEIKETKKTKENSEK